MNQDIKKRIINKIFAIVFLLTIFFVPLFLSAKIQIDFICTLTFAVNGILFITGIYKAIYKYSISMELLYWLFMFFFMYFAPMIQYRMDSYPWRGAVTGVEILYANGIILLFNAFFILGNYFERKFRIAGLSENGITRWLSSALGIKKKFRIVFSMIIMLLTVYSVYKTGLAGIIVSRTQATNAFYSGNNSAIELIVESVIPAFFTYIVADAAQNIVQKKENGVRFVLLLICMLLCFFPTTIPRFKTATIYGVLFLLVFPWFSKGSRFFWLFSIGLFVLFPLLSAFRYVVSQNMISDLLKEGFFESYTEGDYDAYRMLVSAIRYVSSRGSTFGYQLLGVILFFIPSSIWKSKPIGSGGMLIKSELGQDVFSNVSCPFIAEGLVNFGIMGVALFAVLLGIFVSNLDKKYWNHVQYSNGYLVCSPYLFLVFMLFFVMRGDLLSGFAYVCGFIATGFLLKPFTKQG